MNHPFQIQTNDRKFIDAQLSKRLNFPSEQALEGYISSDLLSHISNNSFFIRAKKAGGKEQTPSAFFEKLYKNNGVNKYISWLDQLYDSNFQYSARPNPIATNKPNKISVSAIETLMENPYGFYAKYILKLKKLEPIDSNLSTREFGTHIHEVIAESPTSDISCNAYVAGFLEKFTIKTLAYNDNQEVKHYWNLRAKKIAEWLWEYEHLIKDNLHKKQNETYIHADFLGLQIYARPDRIEHMKNHEIKVIDYKTGSVPAKIDVDSGKNPQLPIESLILCEQYKTIPLMEYHCLSGRKDDSKIYIVSTNLMLAKEGLEKTLSKYIMGDETFFCVADESALKKTRDYVHFSRIKEWLD
jgi:ATP-dependent helicase/nuclease subunit B